MTRTELDVVLGPPAMIDYDEEISGMRMLTAGPGKGVVFLPLFAIKHREVRTYVGPPDRNYSRDVIKVGFSRNDPGAEDVLFDYQPTCLGTILDWGKKKLHF